MSEPTPVAEEDIQRRLERVLIRELGAATATVSNYTRLGGGYSRIMARFDADIDGTRNTLVARTDQDADHKLVDFDSGAEWRLLAALTDSGAALAPRARCFDSDGELQGTSTIVLDYVDGEGLSAALAQRPAPAQATLVDALCDLAAEIHAVDLQTMPDTLHRPASWHDYISTAIDQWRQMDTEHVETNPFIRYVAAWLDANRPIEAPLTLLHGDFQSPNMVLTPFGSLIAVDWEFAHIGDPREDLGWLEMIENYSPVRTYGVDPEGFCARYRERTGLSEDIINPRAVSYFSILATGRIFSTLYRQIGDLARGANQSLPVAYSAAAAVTMSHGVWLDLIRQLSIRPEVPR